MATLGITKIMELLGGTVEFSLYKAEVSLTEIIFEEIYSEMLRLQKIFNFYDSESELSMLNQKRTLGVSEELKEVIEMCLPYCDFTNGAYDISKGKEFIQRKKGVEFTPVNCCYKDIKINGNVVSLLNPAVMIDLGSVAKGYIGDKIKEFLEKKRITSAFIDLRGDLIFYGEFMETINIQHPRDPEKTIFSFKKANAAVATSGDYKQYNGSYENSHILNAKDFCSVTVVAKTLAEADILATCIFTGGVADLEKYAEKMYFAVTTDLKIYQSKNFL